MIYSLLFFFIPLLFATDFIDMDVSAELTAVINTTLGPVQGEILKTISKGVPYSSFKGIRFGKPPIGQLRFKPPSFADPWTEVVNATVKGSDCTQYNNDKGIEGEEDCLFINIFSSVTDLDQSPRELKAVMVWIFGGAFSRGSSNPDHYGPDFLIENDVVVVTFNYRLGVIGFLTLNHPNAMGNAGLKDQQLALKWVHLNIEKFHGDPAKVTIFGDSSGGASALYHTLSDNSQGLFRSAISTSGSPMNPWAFMQSSIVKNRTIQLVNMLGYNTTDKEQLVQIFYNASVDDLVYYAAQLSHEFTVFGPVLEDPSISPNSTAFLSTCIVKKYESGNFSKVPYLMGFAKDETLTYTNKNYWSSLINEVKEIASMTNTSFSIPSVYSVPEEEWNWPLVKETSDLYYKAGIERTQRYITARGSQPFYYYRLTLAARENSFHFHLYDVPEAGAGHCDIVGYIWWASNGMFSFDPKDPKFIARERVTRMWTNFVKYGNPTPDGVNDSLLNITWPDYGTSQIYLDIDVDLSLGGLNFNENTEAIIEASEPLRAVLKDCSVNETHA